MVVYARIIMTSMYGSTRIVVTIIMRDFVGMMIPIINCSTGVMSCGGVWVMIAITDNCTGMVLTTIVDIRARTMVVIMNGRRRVMVTITDDITLVVLSAIVDSSARLMVTAIACLIMTTTFFSTCTTWRYSNSL